MDTKANILDIRNLTVGFKTLHGVIHAVKEVSFSLAPGESIGIVGESGSGKSVTALSVMRLLTASNAFIEGEIIFHSDLQKNKSKNGNLLTFSEKEMRAIRGSDIAMIFQEPNTALNPVLTCGFQLMEAIKVHNPELSTKGTKEKAIMLFDRVELSGVENIFTAYPHQLSGGQKQRVLLAMAISCEPAVLIADEPTTSLDVTVQASIISLLKALQKETNMALIFISHDLGVIGQIANRVLVMYKGQFVENALVYDIFNNPKHPYTKALLACRPPLHQKPVMLPVIADFMFEDINGIIHETPEDNQKVNPKVSFSEEEQKISRNIANTHQPVLVVENIKTWFPVKGDLFEPQKKFNKAVDGVSFEIYSGETMGLVGESGCGKTTLCKSILRLIKPTYGKVLFKNKDLELLKPLEMREMRKYMQVIFQDPYSSLNPNLSIGEAIIEPMLVHRLHGSDKERRKRMLYLLDRVGLSPNASARFPYEFSGGQRQRIAIARALAVEPVFLLCDEPVSALDVSVQANVLNLLNELKADLGLSFLFISHDLSVVKYMSDRMMVMHNGKIEETGTPDELFKKPTSTYTQKLIAAIPGFHEPT